MREDFTVEAMFAYPCTCHRVKVLPRLLKAYTMSLLSLTQSQGVE